MSDCFLKTPLHARTSPLKNLASPPSKNGLDVVQLQNEPCETTLETSGEDTLATVEDDDASGKTTPILEGDIL